MKLIYAITLSLLLLSLTACSSSTINTVVPVAKIPFIIETKSV